MPGSVLQNAVRVGFVAVLAGVWWLDHRAPTSASSRGGEAPPFRLREVSGELGIDFRHQPCELDPQIKNIEPHVAGLGASVAVCDADGDGRPDLLTTSSAFGSPSALYLSLIHI